REAGPAKRGLSAVPVVHLPLNRMQRAVGAFQSFDGDQFLAVERGHELNARIDRAKAHGIAVELSKDHGTRAAIALGASLLGADTPQLFAEQVEHASRRRYGFDGADLAVEHETNRVASFRRLLPSRHPALLG